MKDTFSHLPHEKRQRILDACVSEFGEHGYDKGSTDRIIKKASISKGGLYEYIESKEELFLYICDYVYASLYGYIHQVLNQRQRNTPKDLLHRIALVASIAIDFYLQQPEIVAFITKTNAITEPMVAAKASQIFDSRFLMTFGDADTGNVRYPKERVLDLMRWMLLKTRNDFLAALKTNADIESVKKSYFLEWEFFLNILQNGLYKEGDTSFTQFASE